MTESNKTMWVGHATSRVLQAATILLVLRGLYVLSVQPDGEIVVLGVVAFLVSVFSRITVMIDQRGITILYSWLRWPKTVVKLADVETFETTNLNPWKWGGWGYRGSRAGVGRAAVLIRGGEGLKVSTRNGHQLSISVDDPHEGVAALQTLLAGSNA